MRVLFLSRWFPFPPNNGSKIRVLNLLRRLSASHEVDLVSFGEPTDLVNVDRGLRWAYCSSVDVIQYREFRPRSLRSVLAYFSASPRSLVDTHSQRFAASVAGACRRFQPDVVIASQLQCLPYALQIPDVPLVFEELELTVFKDELVHARSLSTRTRAYLAWHKLTTYLRRSIPRFAACTVVSELERSLVEQVLPNYRRVEVLPNAIDVSEYEGFCGEPQANTLIFSGGLSYKPNYEGLRYFLERVFPLVQETIPSVTLSVTGSTEGVDLQDLPRSAGVRYLGYLPDVRPYVGRSWVAVVPILRGGGTRLKILEAMALGTPVVSTSKGAEGLDVDAGTDLVVGDNPTALARSIIEILQSPARRSELSRAGRFRVRKSYDWARVGQELDRIVECAVATSVTPRLMGSR